MRVKVLLLLSCTAWCWLLLCWPNEIEARIMKQRISVWDAPQFWTFSSQRCKYLGNAYIVHRMCHLLSVLLVEPESQVNIPSVPEGNTRNTPGSETRLRRDGDVIGKSWRYSATSYGYCTDFLNVNSHRRRIPYNEKQWKIRNYSRCSIFKL